MIDVTLFHILNDTYDMWMIGWPWLIYLQCWRVGCCLWHAQPMLMHRVIEGHLRLRLPTHQYVKPHVLDTVNISLLFCPVSHNWNCDEIKTSHLRVSQMAMISH